VKPALSILLFTTITGAAQGAAVALAAATLAGQAPAALTAPLLWLIAAMLLAGLTASFFHLGHPLRAWRAARMWRTSWMSREVIVLPAFIALVAVWAAFASAGESPAAAAPAAAGGAPAALDAAAHARVHAALAWLVIAGAFALWVCTAMIYICIRFIQEWAHPLTFINYVTLGLASGLLVCAAAAAVAGEPAFARLLAPWSLAATALAWFTRALALARNARLVPRSTLQSATGIQAARLKQTSMGMTGGSFNTREFFHRAGARAMRAAKTGFQALAFAAPLLLTGAALASGQTGCWLAALASQAAGLLIERWFFFAQARHPQNLYYQIVS
jgi:DMSO reductase anchor subunit